MIDAATVIVAVATGIVIVIVVALAVTADDRYSGSSSG